VKRLALGRKVKGDSLSRVETKVLNVDGVERRCAVVGSAPLEPLDLMVPERVLLEVRLVLETVEDSVLAVAHAVDPPLVAERSEVHGARAVRHAIIFIAVVDPIWVNHRIFVVEARVPRILVGRVRRAEEDAAAAVAAASRTPDGMNRIAGVAVDRRAVVVVERVGRGMKTRTLPVVLDVRVVGGKRSVGVDDDAMVGVRPVPVKAQVLRDERVVVALDEEGVYPATSESGGIVLEHLVVMRARERVNLVVLVERVVMGVVTALRVLVNRLGGVDVLVGEDEARVLDGRLVGVPRKTVHVGDAPVVVRSVRVHGIVELAVGYAHGVVGHDVGLEVGHGCGCGWVGWALKMEK
jgi:hypothetical protein